MNAPPPKNDSAPICDTTLEKESTGRDQEKVSIRPQSKSTIAKRTIWLCAVSFIAAVAFVASRTDKLAKLLARSSSTESSVTVTPVRIFDVGQGKQQLIDGSLTGVIQPRYETPIAFRVAGKILSRKVDTGQRVSKGDTLFELDASDYQLQVDVAKANLAVAKATLHRTTADEKRLKELLNARAISPSEYERALADRDMATGQQQSAERQLELAQNQLAYCALHADFDGVVTKLNAEVGQIVSIGGWLGSIARLDELEAVVDIPEQRMDTMIHLPTRVSFWSLPETTFEAKLREVSPVADPITRTYQARYTLVDPTQAVKLGMTATVSFEKPNHEESYLIPASSIFASENSSQVWLFNAETQSISPQPIVIGSLVNDLARVTSGLKRGDQIVSAGVQKLDASMRVRRWESKP